MDIITKIALILIILLVVAVCILSLTISNKNKTIDNLEIKLSMSNDAIGRQNAEIEALKLNKDDLVSELNKTANEIGKIRDKIKNMPITTCQDKLSVIDSIFKEATR